MLINVFMLQIDYLSAPQHTLRTCRKPQRDSGMTKCTYIARIYSMSTICAFCCKKSNLMFELSWNICNFAHIICNKQTKDGIPKT